MISSFAAAKLMSSVSRVLRLSIKSVSGTFGWKNIGASRIVRTDWTPGKFSSCMSKVLIVAKDWGENKLSFGVKVMIRKSELPNFSPVSL